MLEVKNLYAGYHGKNVIHDITFSLPYKKNISILGPNGCGKTTLLRAIASLISFQGNISIDGKGTDLMKRKELASKIAVMSQITTVYFPYTVFETVMLGRYQSNAKGFFPSATSEDYEIVEKSIKVVGLSDLKDKSINELSGGQLQRVFLAKTIAQEPQIILLDEPTNHLDLKYQTEIIGYLREWGKQENHCVIGVFHDINLSLQLSEDILVIKDGRILGMGNFYDIATPSFLKDVYGMDVAAYMHEAYSKWNTIQRRMR